MESEPRRHRTVAFNEAGTKSLTLPIGLRRHAFKSFLQIHIVTRSLSARLVQNRADPDVAYDR